MRQFRLESIVACLLITTLSVVGIVPTTGECGCQCAGSLLWRMLFAVGRFGSGRLF